MPQHQRHSPSCRQLAWLLCVLALVASLAAGASSMPGDAEPRFLADPTHQQGLPAPDEIGDEDPVADLSSGGDDPADHDGRAGAGAFVPSILSLLPPSLRQSARLRTFVTVYLSQAPPRLHA